MNGLNMSPDRGKSRASAQADPTRLSWRTELQTQWARQLTGKGNSPMAPVALRTTIDLAPDPQLNCWFVHPTPTRVRSGTAHHVDSEETCFRLK
jgi:hypothetical protein